MPKVNVTITVEVDGETKKASASATTDGDAQGLAEGLLVSTNRDISRWLRRGMSDEVRVPAYLR